MSQANRIATLERKAGAGEDTITLVYENGYTETLTKAEYQERDRDIIEWLRDAVKGGPKK